MKIVCIMGIDGAGKTTLARNTVAALRARGLEAGYFYGRHYALFSRTLLRLLARRPPLRGQDEFVDYWAYTAAKKQALRNPPIRAAYVVTVLLDYYLRSWRRLLPHLFSSRIVVSDRYLYDTIVGDLAVFLDYSPARATRLIDWGLKLVPRPVVTVLLDVPLEVALARKTDVPHADYLACRRILYQQVKDRPEIQELDGTQPPDTLVRAVLGMLNVEF